MSLKKISKEQPKNFEFNSRKFIRCKKNYKNTQRKTTKCSNGITLFIAQKQNNNWIPLAAMKYIAKFLEMPYIKVYEVATFYSYV